MSEAAHAAESPRSALAGSGLHKRYDAVVALRGVDFSVTGGEIVALAGENGSGKSTLARILAGATPPDGGSISLDGDPIVFARPADALAAGVAVVTQELTAVPALSVAENVLLPTARSVLVLRTAKAMAMSALPLMQRVGLTVHPMAPFQSLSPGEAVLAEIARGLSSDPRFLILDEVTTRLGGREVEALFELLEGLRSAGLGIVFITHRLAEIRALADRTVVLRDGAVVGQLTRAEATDERISAMMVGRELDKYSRTPKTAPGRPRLEVRELVPDGFPAPISLHVHPGEVVGLAGLVGSGRSEVLETVAGARPSLAGQVSVDGERVASSSVRAARSARIAFVPEDRHRQGLILHGSLRMNTALGSWRWRSITHSRPELALARRAVESTRIKASDPEAAVATLSGGNQQKVVIGRVLGQDPKVLLLDEPTRGIDVGARAEIYHLIDQLAARGMAVLMASSELLEILALCDRVLVMHDRRIAGEIPASEATETKIALLAGGG